MMKPDRSLQLQILTALRDSYPEVVQIDQLPCYSEDDNFMANAFYLADHDLINPVTIAKEFRKNDLIITAQITAKGIDFLEDDGGLSAILGVVTIKLETNTLQALVESKINQSIILAPTEKKTLISQLKSLPAEAIKHLTMKLLEKGVGHLPEAFDAIQSFFRSPS